MKNIVILGAGTAGTMAAHHLRKVLPVDEWVIKILDEEPLHYYQPGFLFLPFGKYTEKKLTKKKSDVIPKNVNLIIERIEKIDSTANKVHLTSGSVIDYDVLIVATGVKTCPEQTPGLKEGIDRKKDVFDFYTFEGALGLRGALQNFKGGRLVLQVVETPVKCPVAPLEFVFLANEYFSRRGLRDKVSITYVTPLDGAFTKPIAAKYLGDMFNDRSIDIIPNFGTESVDADSREIVGYDGRKIPYDLLVTVPINMGDSLIARSGMGNEFNLVPTDPNTLQSEKYKNVFVVGDAGNFPTSKAGSVAHFQIETLVQNILHYIRSEPLEKSFDGHANCFVESGYGKALLLDFNYTEEPKPGRFPFKSIGPMKLLGESRINHIGKIAFRWIYWQVLMRGHHMPGISSKMK